MAGIRAPMHYLRPDTLDKALDALRGGDRRVAAGCTDLFPATEARVLPGPVVDVTGIPELRGISRDGSGWRIGATTTWTDVIRADLPPAFDGLKLAAGEVGAKQIQNRGTVAGNLCNASPAADGVPPLLTLDAEVEVRSADDARHLPLTEFLTGPRQTALAPGEMVVALHVPAEAGEGVSRFVKLGARSYLVISIAMCAARIVFDGNTVARAALAVGACGPVAVRLPEVEAVLVGQPLDVSRIGDGAVAEALAPIDDVRGSAAYRSRAAAELMRRTLVPFTAQVAA